jgi:hypothetical protein
MARNSYFFDEMQRLAGWHQQNAFEWIFVSVS